VIVDLVTSRYEAPLREPFVTHLRRVSHLTGLIVHVVDDSGERGVGEAVPTLQITGESLEGIEAAINGPLRDAVLGGSVDELEALTTRLQRALVANPSAKAGVDIALHDLWARLLGRPLHVLLGGARSQLVSQITVSLASPDEMSKAASARVAEGFTWLKVKLGGPPALDLARVRAVRAAIDSAPSRPGTSASNVSAVAVPVAVHLRVDANQAWSAKEAIGLVRAFEDEGIGVEVVEQPVPARDLDGLARVTQAVDTPVMADESCFGTSDLIEIVRRRAADAVNVKLMKSGGIRPALDLLAIAAGAEMECCIGSMMETSVSATAAAAVAASSSLVTSVDLDAPWWASTHPLAGGARWDGEQITLSDQPGLGHDLRT